MSGKEIVTALEPLRQPAIPARAGGAGLGLSLTKALADANGASFHLGSSRCGLVGSPIACEGSRTGFYLEENIEHEIQPPEEIRKANLCGADLRGAEIDGVDFYLVDLRGAQYTSDQALQFRRTGAILRDCGRR